MKWIFFDIDGTLLDTVPVHSKTIEQYMKKHYNIKINKKKIESYFGLTANTFFKTLSKLYFNSPKKAEELQALHIKYLSSNLKNRKIKIKVLKNVKTVLRKLSKNYNLGIITGNIPVLGKILLKESDLDKFFKAKYFTTKEIKERRELVFKAKKKAKGKLVTVGDTISDLEAAKANNLTCVCVTTGSFSYSSLKKAGAKYIIKDMKDFPKVLEKLDF